MTASAEASVAPWRPFELVTFDPTKIEECPWNRCNEWSGDFVAIGDHGTPADLGDGGLQLLARDVRPQFVTQYSDDDGRSAFVERVLALTPGADSYERYEERSYRYLDEICGIAKLRDGRFVAWESMLDASGTGFHLDAIGGHADILIANTAHAAWLSISEKGRWQMQFATLASEEALVNVLHDRYLELRDSRRPLTPSNEDVKVSSTRSLYGAGDPAVLRVAAPIGQLFIRTDAVIVYCKTGRGDAEWKPIGTSQRPDLHRYIHSNLCLVAAASGEFGDLLEPRVRELVARFDLRYETTRGS